MSFGGAFEGALPKAATSSSSILPKACENCRVRKVRCNRQEPCSNCQTSNISCRPALSTNRRKPRPVNDRHARHASTSDKHDSASPAVVERSTASFPHESPVSRTTAVSTPSGPSTDSLRVLAEAAEQSPIVLCAFEGSSSFAEQAMQASRIAGVDSDTPHGLSGESHHEAVEAAICEPKGPYDNDYCFHDSMTSRNFTLEMPPANFVLDLLKELKKRPSKMLLAYCMHSLSRELELLCQAAYFPIEPLPFGALATMYGLLYYLTLDLFVDSESQLARKYDYQPYLKLIERNFHFCAEQYTVVVTPTDYNIKALCIAIMKAHSDNKPLLCWSLTAAAARQVFGLGYHRESESSDLPEDEAETRRILFWWVYVFDKSLALRLGRTPNIQDYDIDVRWFKISDDPQIEPYDRTNIHWCKLGRLQGLIYESLYSVGALRASRDQRAASVQDISSQLEAWFEDWKTYDNSRAAHLEFFNHSFNIVEPVYYATQALVHRASTSPGDTAEVTPACYSAASDSLRAYLKAFKNMRTKSLHLYAHAFVDEIMFYTSMTPLIIIFMHTINTPNYGDVDLLVKCQETLEGLKVQSKETARILQVCKIFSRVARSRLQASQTSDQTGSTVPTAGGTLTNIQQAMQISASTEIGTTTHDEFGSFSTPEDFDYAQMSAFFSGWLDCDRMPTELLDMDFGGS